MGYLSVFLSDSTIRTCRVHGIGLQASGSSGMCAGLMNEDGRNLPAQCLRPAGVGKRPPSAPSANTNFAQFYTRNVIIFKHLPKRSNRIVTVGYH